MNTTETKTQLKKKIALHGSRKVFKYVVIKGVEWASICSCWRMRSLYVRKQPALLCFEFNFNLVPRSSPLAFERQREVPGTVGKASDKFYPNIVFCTDDTL